MTNNHYKTTAPALAALLALCILMPTGSALGQDVTVDTSLSATRTRTGQPVTLEIRVTGSRAAKPPQSIPVEGLQINYTGQSMQLRIENFKSTSFVTHTYSVLPVRTGEFTIPAVEIEVDGEKFKTEPLKLTVDATGSSEKDTGDLVFAELIVPKTEVFVGEVVPVEIRVYVDERVHFQLDGLPQFAEEGFTTRRMPNARQQSSVREGKRYNMVVFQCAVTPIKSGELQLGPGEIRALIQVPDQRRQSSPLDSFFGNINRVRTHETTISTESVQLKVKALPTEGMPENFSGAVGRFQLSSELPVKQGSVGDPLTLRLAVTGRGDFDRIEPPVKTGGDAWRSYPPSARFDQDDELGISGRKTWEFALVPEQPQEQTPVFEFSYFDDAEEKYVTLRSDALPVTITGGPRPPSKPPAAAVPAAPDAVPSDPPATAERDILFILEKPSPQGTFAAWYRHPSFHRLQAGAAVVSALLLVGAWLTGRRGRRGPPGGPQEISQQLTKEIGAASNDGGALLHAAVRWVDFHFDAKHPVPEELYAETVWLRARHDEMRYAGGGSESSTQQDRERVHALIEKLDKVKEVGK